MLLVNDWEKLHGQTYLMKAPCSWAHFPKICAVYMPINADLAMFSTWRQYLTSVEYLKLYLDNVMHCCHWHHSESINYKACLFYIARKLFVSQKRSRWLYIYFLFHINCENFITKFPHKRFFKNCIKFKKIYRNENLWSKFHDRSPIKMMNKIDESIN